MKSVVILVFSVLFVSSVFGQLVNVRVGGNVSLAAVFTESSAFGGPTDQDTSAVLATMIPLVVDFSPLKFVSVSAGFRTGSWLNEDPNDASAKNYKITKQKTNQFLLGVKLYPVRKKNFDLYLGYDFGIGGFDKVKESTTVLNIDEEQSWRGTSNNINLGLNWYFGGKFGMYYQMGYTGYNLDLKSYKLNNENLVDTWEFKSNAKVTGVQIELGFCYKFGSLDY